jgi:polyhydroxybutyrate depolymerase
VLLVRSRRQPRAERENREDRGIPAQGADHAVCLRTPGDIIGGVVLINKAAPGLAALLLLAVFPAAALAAEPMQLVVNGQTRAYLLAGPPGPAPRPTILMLHGLPGTGAAIARRTGLDQLAPRAGFVAVFPEGLRNRWNHFLPGKEPPLFVQNSQQVGGVPDDAGFLKLLVTDLVGRGVSDPKRIYLAGVSNGAFMSLRMICTDAGVFAAVGVLVGGMPERLGADCRPPKPIAALMINGTADQIIPYDGGMVQPGSAFAAWPTEHLVGFFRELNGCAATSEQAVLPGTTRHKIEVMRWNRCAGAPVVFHRVIGGDHAALWQLDVGLLLVNFFRDKVHD